MKCNNCKRDLTSAKIENYSIEKDLLICSQCWGNEVEKYRDYEVGHFCLFKRSGGVDGSSEAIVVWSFKK